LTFLSGVLVAIRMSETLRFSIAQNELVRLLNAKSVILIDVRTPDEFKNGHIDGSRNIPINVLEAHIDELRTDKIVVTVCAKGGGRSEKAAGLLKSHGIKSRFLEHGFNGWPTSEKIG